MLHWKHSFASYVINEGTGVAVTVALTVAGIFLLRGTQMRRRSCWTQRTQRVIERGRIILGNLEIKIYMDRNLFYIFYELFSSYYFIYFSRGLS